MIKIDFHVLAETNTLAALRYACQLVEQAYDKQQRIYIHVDTAEEGKRMDTLLWTYRENSFLPHDWYNTQNTDSLPIHVGNTHTPPTDKEVLVNLSKTVPEFFPQFKQIIEIVFSDQTVQQLARERFKQYRDLGYEITTHKIQAN